MRLGWIVAEFARRYEIRSGDGADLENKLVDHLISLAQVDQRQATEAELRELVEG